MWRGSQYVGQRTGGTVIGRNAQRSRAADYVCSCSSRTVLITHNGAECLGIGDCTGPGRQCASEAPKEHWHPEKKRPRNREHQRFSKLVWSVFFGHHWHDPLVGMHLVAVSAADGKASEKRPQQVGFGLEWPNHRGPPGNTFLGRARGSVAS